MKKYLKTPEAIVDALRQGEIVVTKSGEKLSLYNGIIIGKFKTGYLINSCITGTDEPYIEEPEPLKIEVGKFYKTRAGEKARCYYDNGQKAFFTRDGQAGYLEVSSETGCFWEDKDESLLDIIGPWED